MVHGHVALHLFIILEQRKVNHPQRPPLTLIDEVQLLAQMQPKPTERVMDDSRLISHEQQEIPRFGLREGS